MCLYSLHIYLLIFQIEPKNAIILPTGSFKVLNLSNLNQLNNEDENKANQLIGNLKLIRYVSIFKQKFHKFTTVICELFVKMLIQTKS